MAERSVSAPPAPTLSTLKLVLSTVVVVVVSEIVKTGGRREGLLAVFRLAPLLAPAALQVLLVLARVVPVDRGAL